ncbi:MAG TPA: sulfur carrier protein ThiS [Acidobacteriaceae bacterium]|nr:sulfur carrier protein ThiS [Acidobacteriaceae bacterium]
MQIVINGSDREFPSLSPSSTVADLLAALQIKGDRVAIEHNGTIVRRNDWPSTPVHPGDKFEVVHFVGGGADSLPLR